MSNVGAIFITPSSRITCRTGCNELQLLHPGYSVTSHNWFQQEFPHSSMNDKRRLDTTDGYNDIVQKEICYV